MAENSEHIDQIIGLTDLMIETLQATIEETEAPLTNITESLRKTASLREKTVRLPNFRW